MIVSSIQRKFSHRYSPITRDKIGIQFQSYKIKKKNYLRDINGLLSFMNIFQLIIKQYYNSSENYLLTHSKDSKNHAIEVFFFCLMRIKIFQEFRLLFLCSL